MRALGSVRCGPGPQCLVPVRSTPSRTPGSAFPNLPRDLPHPSPGSAPGKRPGRRRRPPSSRLASPRLRASTLGYLRRSEQPAELGCAGSHRLAAVRDTAVLERSVSLPAAAGDTNQSASSHWGSQPIGRHQALREGGPNLPGVSGEPTRGPRKASSRSWPEQCVFAWIGWRGGVWSADWSPGNGPIPRECGLPEPARFPGICGVAGGFSSTRDFAVANS